MGFLRRTAVATVACSLIVALFATVYFPGPWGLRYLIFAVWPMGLYGLTGFVLREMMADHKARAFLYIALKLAGFFALCALYVIWPIPRVGNEADRAQVAAMFAGISTPFVVFVLRFVGFMLEVERKRQRSPGVVPAGSEK